MVSRGRTSVLRRAACWFAGLLSRARTRAFALLRRARYFSFACPKEKYPRENDTPLPRLVGILPTRFAAGLRGLSTGHPALATNWFASMRTTLRAFPPPARRCRGDLKSSAHPARTFQKSQIGARAKPQQIDALLWLLLFSYITGCGPGWPAAPPGVPCAAVSRGRQAAQRASAGMPMPFRPDRSPVEKPGPDSRTCRPWMGGKRQAGYSFSLVTFSLSTQRESDSGAIGARKLLLSRKPRLTAQRIWFRARTSRKFQSVCERPPHLSRAPNNNRVVRV